MSHTSTLYGVSLLFSLCGIVLIDLRITQAYKIIRPIALVYGIGAIAFFIGLDILGIALGIFSTNQAMVSGIFIGTNNLPIEEFLFLSLLTYAALISYTYFDKKKR